MHVVRSAPLPARSAHVTALSESSAKRWPAKWASIGADWSALGVLPDTACMQPLSLLPPELLHSSDRRPEADAGMAGPGHDG